MAKKSRAQAAVRNKKSNIQIILLALLLAAAVILLLLLCMKSCRSGEGAEEAKAPPSAIGGGDPIPDGADTPKDPNNLYLPAYDHLTFRAGSREQEIVLPNPGENTCLIRISLTLRDGTEIYRSELVEPGHYTLPITLTAPMERGEYTDATLRYECFTNDSARSPLNGASGTLDITVE